VRAVWRLVLAAGLGACAPLPDPLQGRYVNPVLDADFADPALLKAPDGWFYAYATQTSTRNRLVNIQVARSPDLVRWEHLGDALPVKPSWAGTKQNFWAPHVIHHPPSGRYLMYYSAEPDASSGGKCLAVAVSRAPRGPFVDSGTPMLCGQGFEHIDPMAFDDPKTGTSLLYWGSGFRPIRVQPLAPDRLRFLPGSTPRNVVLPDERKPYRSLVEAPWVVFRDGFYLLFYSGDRCCNREANYAIMVARSDSAFGPFHAPDDVMLKRNWAWHAPGHNAVVTDDAGVDWILYHAIDETRPWLDDLVHGRVSRRVLLLDRLVYRNGWPKVAADVPSASAQAAPLVRP
jgi:arabinan endo-1,5-alpha-L-arabinosidase